MGIKIYTIAIGSNARTLTYLFDSSTRNITRVEQMEDRLFDMLTIQSTKIFFRKLPTQLDPNF